MYKAFGLIKSELSATDYYPYGMGMPGRNFNSTKYKFGFNGKENDDEINSGGNSVDFGSRIYDSRLGNFLSSDKYNYLNPNYSTYCGFGNNPIFYTDKAGNYFDGYLAGLNNLKAFLRIIGDHEMLKIIEKMEKSPVCFYIYKKQTEQYYSSNDLLIGGNTSPDPFNKRVILTVYDFKLTSSYDHDAKLAFFYVSLLEEIFHGWQLVFTGDIDYKFSANGKIEPGLAYNLPDELNAGGATYLLWSHFNKNSSITKNDYVNRKKQLYGHLTTNEQSIFSLDVMFENAIFQTDNPGAIIINKDTYNNGKESGGNDPHDNNGAGYPAPGERDTTYSYPEETEPVIPQPDDY